MATLTRIRATWTGFSGGPGVSTFYSLGSISAVPDIRALFLGLATYLPTDVQIQVENVGDLINDVNGELTGAWSVDPVLPVNGTSPGPYAAPVGVMAKWTTATILDGHRVAGRTFIVPVEGGFFSPDGTPNTDDLNALRGVVSTYFAAAVGDLVVWHRPRVAKAATAYHPAVTARAGGSGVVVACNVPDKAVVLRSRRD